MRKGLVKWLIEHPKRLWLIVRLGWLFEGLGEKIQDEWDDRLVEELRRIDRRRP